MKKLDRYTAFKNEYIKEDNLLANQVPEDDVNYYRNILNQGFNNNIHQRLSQGATENLSQKTLNPLEKKILQPFNYDDSDDVMYNSKSNSSESSDKSSSSSEEITDSDRDESQSRSESNNNIIKTQKNEKELKEKNTGKIDKVNGESTINIGSKSNNLLQKVQTNQNLNNRKNLTIQKTLDNNLPFKGKDQEKVDNESIEKNSNKFIKNGQTLNTNINSSHISNLETENKNNLQYMPKNDRNQPMNSTDKTISEYNNLKSKVNITQNTDDQKEKGIDLMNPNLVKWMKNPLTTKKDFLISSGESESEIESSKSDSDSAIESSKVSNNNTIKSSNDVASFVDKVNLKNNLIPNKALSDVSEKESKKIGNENENIKIAKKEGKDEVLSMGEKKNKLPEKEIIDKSEKIQENDKMDIITNQVESLNDKNMDFNGNNLINNNVNEKNNYINKTNKYAKFSKNQIEKSSSFVSSSGSSMYVSEKSEATAINFLETENYPNQNTHSLNAVTKNHNFDKLTKNKLEVSNFNTENIIEGEKGKKEIHINNLSKKDENLNNLLKNEKDINKKDPPTAERSVNNLFNEKDIEPNNQSIIKLPKDYKNKIKGLSTIKKPNAKENKFNSFLFSEDEDIFESDKENLETKNKINIKENNNKKEKKESKDALMKENKKSKTNKEKNKVSKKGKNQKANTKPKKMEKFEEIQETEEGVNSESDVQAKKLNANPMGINMKNERKDKQKAENKKLEKNQKNKLEEQINGDKENQIDQLKKTNNKNEKDKKNIKTSQNITYNINEQYEENKKIQNKSKSRKEEKIGKESEFDNIVNRKAQIKENDNKKNNIEIIIEENEQKDNVEPIMKNKKAQEEIIKKKSGKDFENNNKDHQELFIENKQEKNAIQEEPDKNAKKKNKNKSSKEKNIKEKAKEMLIESQIGHLNDNSNLEYNVVEISYDAEDIESEINNKKKIKKEKTKFDNLINEEPNNQSEESEKMNYKNIKSVKPGKIIEKKHTKKEKEEEKIKAFLNRDKRKIKDVYSDSDKDSETSLREESTNEKRKGNRGKLPKKFKTESQYIKFAFKNLEHIIPEEEKIKHEKNPTFGINGRYSRRVRIPRLNVFAGEKINYKAAPGDGGYEVASIFTSKNSLKEYFKDVEIERPKKPKKRLIKKALKNKLNEVHSEDESITEDIKDTVKIEQERPVIEDEEYHIESKEKEDEQEERKKSGKNLKKSIKIENGIKNEKAKNNHNQEVFENKLEDDVNTEDEIKTMKKDYKLTSNENKQNEQKLIIPPKSYKPKAKSVNNFILCQILESSGKNKIKIGNENILKNLLKGQKFTIQPNSYYFIMNQSDTDLIISVKYP